MLHEGQPLKAISRIAVERAVSSGVEKGAATLGGSEVLGDRDEYRTLPRICDSIEPARIQRSWIDGIPSNRSRILTLAQRDTGRKGAIRAAAETL